MAETQVGIKLTLDGAQQVEQGVRRVVDSVGSIGSATSASARQAIDATSSLKSAFASLGSDLKSQLAGTIGAFSGLAAAIGGLNKVVAVQRQFDVLNSSLITMTGSVKDAAVAFGALQDFAVKTPYSLAETVGAFTKLKALGLDPTERAMTSFGNTAAAMGKSLTQFIEAVADASTGEFERLKEFGIKASKEGSNVALTFQGVTTTVKNNADTITEYLTKLGETEFAGAMATRAATLDGAISALGDTWDNLFLTISQKSAGGLIYDSVQVASGAIQSLTKIVEAMSDAADSNARSTGAMAAVQNGITTVFETVAVVGANVAYVLKATGIELGGLAAQAAAVARLDFKGAALIGDEMKRDAAAARAAVDSLTAGILNAKNQTKEAGKTLDDLVKPRPQVKPPIDEDAIKAAKKALQEIEKEAAKGLELYNNLIAETAGFQGDYAEKVSQLAEAYAAGKISLQGLNVAHGELLKKQPAAVEAIKLEAEAYAAARQARLQYAADAEKLAQAAIDGNQALREEIELIGLSAAQQTAVLKQRGQVIILTKEATLAELQRASAITGTMTREEAALQAEIEALKERNELLGVKVDRTAIAEATQATADEWKKTTDQINQSLTDALMRGFESGKGFLENLRDTAVNLFKTMVLQPTIKAILAPVAGGMASMFGVSGAQAGQAGAGGTDIVGTITSGISLLNTGIASSIQAGFSKFAMSSVGQSMGLSSVAADGMGPPAMSSAGQQMGTALGVVGNTLAGYALGSMAKSLISGGYSMGGGMDTFQKVQVAVGSAIGGPLGGAMAGAVAGVFNRAFGRKFKDAGIEGKFGGDTGFSGNQYQFYQGGWFRSDKTTRSPLDEQTANALTGQFRGIQASTAMMAATLGQGTDAIASFTKDIKLSFKDLTEEQIQQKIAEQFADISDELASAVLGTTKTITETVKELQLVSSGSSGDAGDVAAAYAEVEKTVTRVVAVQSEYARTGETSAQTLQRLAGSLTTVNAAFDMLGFKALEASLASGNLASQLIDAVGGGDAFALAAGSLFENYYTEAEKAAYQTELITKELATAGLTMPKTRAEFKAMVEAQSALGPAGKDGLAALLRVNGAFAQLVPAADEAAGAVTSFFNSLAEGVSGQIEDVLTNVLLGKADGATAGAELAAAVVGGVQQAIISGTTSVIAETFTASIIAPIIANVTAGRAAMEGVDLQGAIAAAGAQMQALQAVLTSPEVTSGFASITGALNGLVGAAQGAAAGINGAIGSIGSADPGYTPNLFAIGGSATNTVYRPQEPLRPLVDFTSLQQETLEVNKSVAKLLEEYLNKDETPTDRYEALAEQLADRRIEFNIPGYEQQISGLTNTIADIKDTLAQFNPLIAQFLRGYEVIGDETSGYLRKIAEMIVVRQGDKLNSGFLNGTLLAGGVGYENQSMVDRVMMTLEGTLSGLTSTGNEGKFTDYLLSYLGIPSNTFQLEGDLTQRIEQLALLEKDLREWYLAQSRLIAIEEATALEKETKDAKARTDELRRTGGLEDPIAKLREQFREKMESMNAGIGAALRAEIEVLKAQTADTTELERALDRQKKQMGQIFDQTGSPLQSYVDAIQRQIDSSQLYLDTLDPEASSAAIIESVTRGIFDSQQLLARIQDGSLFAGMQEGIASAEQAILDAMLAATEPAKQQELLDEIARYEGGITEWFKAQAELLSTEMLVDINAQIRALEKADQGPLTAIKAAIDKYVTDLKALDQYTAAAQASVDQLAGLQLTQARGDLEAQLLSKPELEARDLSALTANFAALGQQLPATAADFKALLATITDPTKRDALLELIPAFVALRPPLDGATDAATEAAETIQQAYDRLRAVNRTNEDIARERIDLEERLFRATASQAEIANLARLRIDEYNRSLYDQVIAAEAAQQAVQDTRTATDQALAEVRRLISAEISNLQKTFSATDKAMQAVDRAAAAQRTALQKQITDAKATEASVKGIFDALSSGARELRGEVDSTAAMQAQQARELIRNAIATGVLPSQDALDEAISTSRAGLEAQVYASEKDAEFAKLVLAGELEKLQDIAQPQLSAAEQAVVLAEEQLAALEDQVKQAKAMVDGIRGVDGRVLTVGEAVAELQTAAAAETLAREQIDKLQLQLSEAEKSYNELRGIKTGVDAIAPALQALAEAIAGEKSAAAQALQALAEAIAGEKSAAAQAAALAAAAAAQRQAITNAASGQYGASVEYVRGFGETSAMADTTYANQREADIAALYQNVLGRVADSGGLAYYAGTGLSIAEIAASLEASREDDIRDAYGGAAQQAFNDQVNAALGLESDIRIPGFATGGRYPGGLALVGEEGPELINFSQPGQVYTAPQTRELLGGMGGSERMASLMGEMAQEIRSLRAEVVQLRRSADKGNEHTAVIAQAHEGRGQAPLLVEIAQ